MNSTAPDPLLVSVIMAARNEAGRVREAVESILQQTYRNVELLVFDDGSTDRTFPILEELALRDGRVSICRHERSRGLAYCLNRCAEKAKGNLLARMDADDFALPGRVAKQVAFFESHPEVDILGTAAFLMNATGGITGVAAVETDHDRMASRIYSRNPFIHPTVMMKREVLVRLGGYDESILNAEDYDLWLRAYLSCHFANIPEPLLNYRVGLPVRWERLADSIRVKCRSIRREGRPWTYYYYPLRSLLSVPWTYCRQWPRRSNCHGAM